MLLLADQLVQKRICWRKFSKFLNPYVKMGASMRYSRNDSKSIFALSSLYAPRQGMFLMAPRSLLQLFTVNGTGNGVLNNEIPHSHRFGLLKRNFDSLSGERFPTAKT